MEKPNVIYILGENSYESSVLSKTRIEKGKLLLFEFWKISRRCRRCRSNVIQIFFCSFFSNKCRLNVFVLIFS
mgnify:CR=1 FL=1